MQALDSPQHNSCSHTVVVLWQTCQVVHRNQLWQKKGVSSQDIQQVVEACQEKAAENLTKVRWTMRECFDKGRKVATEYQVGDLVLWRDASTGSGEKGINKKLLNKYGGPYRIAKVLGSDRYKITTVKV